MAVAELGSGTLVADRYKIDRVLGDGGMGVVYLAADLDNGGRPVALKALKPAFFEDAERRRRFDNEIRYTSPNGGFLGHHPNIVSALRSGHDHRAGPFLVMEYVKGPAIVGLRFMLSRALEPDEIYPLALDVARGMCAIHDAGLVHRDLTPRNILVDTSCDPLVAKIIDFSHATSVRGPRLLVGAPGRLTGAHERPGTPGYMAPEQVVGSYPSPANDVFTFGVMLWEVFAGRRAFGERDKETYTRLQQDTPCGPPPLEPECPGLPAAVYELIDDCVEVDPKRRPAAAEVVARLSELVEQGRPTAAVAKGGTEVYVAAQTVAPSAAAPVHTPRVRGWMVAAALAFVLAILVVVGLVVTWEPDRELAQTRVEPPVEAKRPGVSPSGSRTNGSPERSDSGDAPRPEAPATRDQPEPTAEAPPQPAEPHAKPSGNRKPRSQVSASCKEAPARAQEAAKRERWRDVLRHTSRARCWPKQNARLRLRLEAFMELRKWAECAAAARRLNDSFARRALPRCEAHLGASKGPQ